MNTHFTSEWKEWITTNVNAGQDLDGIFKILIDEGFTYSAIAEQLNYQPSRPVEELVNPLRRNNTDLVSQAEPKVQKQAVICNNGKRIKKKKVVIRNARVVEASHIDLRVLDGFLSQQECIKVIEAIKTKLRPSEISNAEVNHYYRNSRTCDLGDLQDAFIEEIDLRICKLLGIHRSYSEVLQGQYYEVGQEFKEHTDYFKKSEFAANCHEFGQRTFTVMVYLNDVESGGETCFVKLGKAFKPKAGTAVIWNNLNADGTPNDMTLHRSNPVKAGSKAIMTKWFRSKPAAGYEYLKMFSKNVNDFG